MRKILLVARVASALGLAACAARPPAAAPVPAAADVPAPGPAASPEPQPGRALIFGTDPRERLVVSFADGGSRLTPDAEMQLDIAARTYRDGHPLVMYVAGFTDRLGSEFGNLILAARRAEAVKRGLIARGIPADRLETAALGEADPEEPTAPGVANPANRRVVITWK